MDHNVVISRFANFSLSIHLHAVHRHFHKDKTAKLEPVCLPWQKLTELSCWASNNQVEFTLQHTAFLSMGFQEHKVLICKAMYQTHL